MPAKYVIESSNLEDLILIESGRPLAHDFKKAPTIQRAKGDYIIIQWVLIGPKGASLSLSYVNSRGKHTIVKKSKIPDDKGVFASTAIFASP